MGHNIQDNLKGYWCALERFHALLRECSRYTVRDFFFKCCAPYVSLKPDMTDRIYDGLRKQRMLCDMLTKFLEISEHSVVEMVTVKFRGLLIFRWFVTKKH